MNPRLFCRERTFHKALLLTYRFDPVFFEQVVLPDLWNGRAGDILVIGDRAQILEATVAHAGQLWHLGRNYLLAPANHVGAFHPKVVLRLGAKDGAVLIGSGNLTSAGWGGQKELGVGWMVGPGHADDGAWLHGFLADVMSWCGSDLERDAVARMRDVPWLGLTAASDATSAILYSRGDSALAPMLARRWAGRRFDSVRVLTGSTDESGAFLRWAHTTFGIKRAVVALTPTLASFDPAQLADLPLELKLVAAPPDRPMHAKCYWFESEGGTSAVMGSANCSAAAWLVPPARGGNIETVVVYESASVEAHAAVLRIFDAPSSTAEDLLGSRLTTPTEPSIAVVPFRLLGLRWDKEAAHVTAVLDPIPSSDNAVALLLGSSALPMSAPTALGGHWNCALTEPPSNGTSFGAVRITRGAETYTTAPRWIDELSRLRHASQTARLLEPFNALERSATAGEQRQMLEDLQEVAQALFSDTAAFRDPGNASKTTADDKPAAAVNPNDLVCHLDEGHDGMPRPGAASPGQLSITGILRMLFAAEGDQPGTDVAAEDEQLDEVPDSSNNLQRDQVPTTTPRDESGLPIEARFKERLAAQIKTFLASLRSSDFADRCSATQLVQAMAFPLAVALRGQKRGWVSAALAEAWGLEIISILFRGDGLLRIVEQRYAEKGQADIFYDIVGDGTLWVVLVSTLGSSRWCGPSAYLEKAIALREVFTASQLLASARPERVSDLLGKVRIDDARLYVADVAPAVTKLLHEVETRLRPIWSDEARAQTLQPITHRTGDLLWRDNVGWAVCLEENALENRVATRVRLAGHEAKVQAGFYVNVSQLAVGDGDLRQQLDQIRARVDGDNTAS